MTELEELQHQINSAINVSQGRLENGANIQDVYDWLQEEVDAIFNGEIIYEIEL